MAVPRLVALDLPGGPEFVVELRRIWDRGDVAFPVDQRLPHLARHDLLAAVGVDAVIASDGESHVVNRSSDLPALAHGDALVVATSGSTGQPKGVVLTHDAVRASARATSVRLGVTADDHWLACLPLSHVGGLSVVTRALATGTPLTVLPGFDANEVQRAGATLVSLVTTTLSRVDPRCFRTIVVGGSSMPPDLPANVVRTYGLTETGSGVVYDGMPLDGVDVRIDGDEILVRGPMLLRCYRDGTSPLVDGWLPTGDLGSWGDDGRLRVAGRRGDLIITGGENVWPEVVERVLRGHPAVADVAVAGVPDPEWGHVVTAFVVLAPPSTVTLADLRNHAKATLPSFSAPRRLVLVDEIPRTNLGKPLRARLTAAAQRPRRP